MWPRNGPTERPPLRGQLLPAVPARGGDEPAGAVASGDRWSAASARGGRASGGADRGGSQAVPERPPPGGPARKRATGDLATLAHQGGGGGDRELPSDRGA